MLKSIKYIPSCLMKIIVPAEGFKCWIIQIMSNEKHYS